METLNYTGKVKEIGTGKPIAGATVVVRRSIHKPDNEKTILQETRHTTDADGDYSFTIPPEQVAERSLYIELDVEHPDYATQAGFGDGLAFIRQEEAKGQRPFFTNISLRPAKPIFGRVETPDGMPAQGVEILVFSRAGEVQPGPLESWLACPGHDGSRWSLPRPDHDARPGGILDHAEGFRPGDARDLGREARGTRNVPPQEGHDPEGPGLRHPGQAAGRVVR